MCRGKEDVKAKCDCGSKPALIIECIFVAESKVGKKALCGERIL